MKSIKKYLFIMAALAAVFGFVACGDDDDESSTAAESAVAVYKNNSYGDVTYMVTFLDNGTWSQVYEYSGKKETMAEGTYTGDPTKDGTIKLTFLGGEHLNAVYKGKTIDHTIENGRVTITGLVYTRQ